MSDRAPAKAGRHSARLRLSNWLEEAALLVVVLTLEVLPLAAWLVLLAAYSSGNLTRTTIPLWLVAGCIAAAWALRRFAAGALDALGTKVYAALLAVEFLIVARVSPDLYGQVGGGAFDARWLGMVGPDIISGSPRVGAALLLLMLLVYLCWRGLSLGRWPLADADTLTSLRNGMAVLIVAAITAAVVQDPTRPSLIGALTFLLPLEVFAGLIGAALARARQRRYQGRGESGATDEYPWLRTSVALSALVVGFSLAVGVVVNYQSVGALLARLGPVGNVVNTVVEWGLNLLGQILYRLLDPIVAAIQRLTSNNSRTLSQPKPVTCVSSPTVRCPPRDASLPPFWQHLALIVVDVLVLVAIAAVFLYVLRAAFAAAARRAGRVADEERESLDARGLLRAQLRGLFARRTGKQGAPAEELPHGSVRYLYREVLRAAAAVGLPRAQAETPDEYAARISRTAPLRPGGAGGDEADEAAGLLALSEAYDVARYAGREPQAPERAVLQQQAARLLQRLRLRR